MFRERLLSRFFRMRATRTLTISATGAGVLTVYVSLPAKGYTGSMVTLSTYWSGVAGGPLDGDTVGVISWGDGTSDTISMPIASTNYSINHTYSTTGTKSVKNVTRGRLEPAPPPSRSLLLSPSPASQRPPHQAPYPSQSPSP